MIVDEQDALDRLSSPLNLMNRLRSSSSSSSSRQSAMGLFGVNRDNKDKSEDKPFTNPFQAPALSTSLTIPAKETEKKIPAESESPELDDLVGNADTQVKLGLAHDEALGVLVDAVKMMKTKLDDIKPDKIPSVISATSKVVDQIQKQRAEAHRKREQREVHFHFYTPTQKKMEEYTVIDVG